MGAVNIKRGFRRELSPSGSKKNMKATDVWQFFIIYYRTGLCGLCGNTGYIAQHVVVAPTGEKHDVPTMRCICPNSGRLDQRSDNE